jgi:hypothetical protein
LHDFLRGDPTIALQKTLIASAPKKPPPGGFVTSGPWRRQV